MSNATTETDIHIAEVGAINLDVYLNLAQAYEAEFSPITHKTPNSLGLYELDSIIGEEVKGYILHTHDHPAGLAAVSILGDGTRDLREFYIIPTMRGRGIGTLFAESIFSLHPGAWTVKQLTEAHHAIRFWQRAFAELKIEYKQQSLNDPYWGNVVMQSFRWMPFERRRSQLDLPVRS